MMGNMGDIDMFGVEFHKDFLDEREKVVTDAGDADFKYYVENQRFDCKLKISFADGKVKVEGVCPDDVKVKEDGCDVKIECKGKALEIELKGSCDDGSLEVKSDRAVKIVLNGLDLRSKRQEALKVNTPYPTYIVLANKSENRLEDKFTAVVREEKGGFRPTFDDNYETEVIDGIVMRKAENRAEADVEKPKVAGVITSEGLLCFSGKGRLEIKGHNKNGVKGKGEIVFRPGNVINVEVTQGKGVSAKGDIRIMGGVLNIDGSDSGEDGLRSDACIYVSGGWTVVKAAGGESSEGIEAKYNIDISDGVVEVAAFDDGINSGGNLIVRGGKVFVASVMNDAIDSNSNLVIIGGTVTAIGGDAPEAGLDAAEEERFNLYINGGTVLSCGGIGGLAARPDKESRQSSIMYNAENADSGAVYRVVRSGKAVMEMKVPRKYRSGATLLFSCPEIEEGKEYEIREGGGNS